MRILFISTTFPDADHPARGTYNAALCQALAETDEVRVISPRMFTEVLTRRKAFGVPAAIKAVGISVEYPTYWYTPKIWQHYYGDQMWWSVRKCVARALNEFQPDAVLSYFAHPDGQVGMQAAHIAGIPSAVIVGGTDVLVLPNDPARGPVVRRVLAGTTRIMTVSEGLRTKCLELGCAPTQVQTIYQGIDPDVFYPGNRPAMRQKLGLDPTHEVLIWVGRMVPIKGLDLLIDAFAQVHADRPQVRLYLLGDGPSKADVEYEANRRGLSEVIRCVGAVGHDRLADWYRAADLCVLSSLSEGLPNVLREALACGTPFVSTNVGSLREIASPEYSQLVDSRDPAEFAAAICTALQPEMRSAAAAYRPRTWRDCACEVRQLFAACVETRNNSISREAVRSTQQRVGSV